MYMIITNGMTFYPATGIKELKLDTHKPKIMNMTFNTGFFNEREISQTVKYERVL